VDNQSSASAVTRPPRISERWKRLRRAQKDASFCGECETPLKTVYRVRVELGDQPLSGILKKAVVPLCRTCAKEEIRYGLHSDAWLMKARPCEGCGRPVVQSESWSYRRQHWLCSDRCRDIVRAAAARDRRRDALEERPCEDCGELFEPRRADARYCSAACRQRAYRSRAAVRGKVA
jgi:hypothetical protein